MRVKHLIELLNQVDPESAVVVYCDGSIFGTDNVGMHEHFMKDRNTNEFYIVACDDWEEDE